MCLRINGCGNISGAPSILVRPKPDGFAAIRFFRKLLRANGRRRPRVIGTGKLRSCAAAKRVVMPVLLSGSTGT
ncbi:MAG TPA: hypothetical protein VES20_03130 [Bryobacteraceae bacterium]|nr:hypothetical protein [Bryobacteraceae bacterium]